MKEKLFREEQRVTGGYRPAGRLPQIGKRFQPELEPPILEDGAGRAALVRRKDNGDLDTPIVMYERKGAKIYPTSDFQTYAQDPKYPEAKKLLDSLEMALKVDWVRDGEIGFEGLKFWLTNPLANPTLIAFTSDLVTSLPSDREPGIDGENAMATAIYNASTTTTFGTKMSWVGRGTLDVELQALLKKREDFVKANRGTQEIDDQIWHAQQNLIKVVTQNAFESEFRDISFSGKNLILLDREEVCAKDPKSVAEKVAHEFLYHLSIPINYKGEPKYKSVYLDWFWQHGEGDEYGWDARLMSDVK
jgi:hypothetical protein